MDAATAAAQEYLLESNVLEFTHQLETWYITALQAKYGAGKGLLGPLQHSDDSRCKGALHNGAVQSVGITAMNER